MIGAIIGDIVGSHFEFDNTNDFNFGLFTEECAYTDDMVAIVEQFHNRKQNLRK